MVRAYVLVMVSSMTLNRHRVTAVVVVVPSVMWCGCRRRRVPTHVLVGTSSSVSVVARMHPRPCRVWLRARCRRRITSGV